MHVKLNIIRFENMSLKLLANNNAKSVLAAGISASATVITVGTGAGALFPVPVSG